MINRLPFAKGGRQEHRKSNFEKEQRRHVRARWIGVELVLAVLVAYWTLSS